MPQVDSAFPAREHLELEEKDGLKREHTQADATKTPTELRQENYLSRVRGSKPTSWWPVKLHRLSVKGNFVLWDN